MQDALMLKERMKYGVIAKVHVAVGPMNNIMLAQSKRARPDAEPRSWSWWKDSQKVARGLVDSVGKNDIVWESVIPERTTLKREALRDKMEAASKKKSSRVQNSMTDDFIQFGPAVSGCKIVETVARLSSAKRRM